MSACYVILAHVTRALAREWALFIRAAKAITWALTREWALALDTTNHGLILYSSDQCYHHTARLTVAQAIYNEF